MLQSPSLARSLAPSPLPAQAPALPQPLALALALALTLTRPSYLLPSTPRRRIYAPRQRPPVIHPFHRAAHPSRPPCKGPASIPDLRVFFGLPISGSAGPLPLGPAERSGISRSWVWAVGVGGGIFVLVKRASARAQELMGAIDAQADAGIAEHSQRFFKTGRGEYGEGDVFVGVRVPQVRRICRDYRDLTIDQMDLVLASPVHEHRLAALVILSEQARRARKRGDTAAQRAFCEFYLARAEQVNNWDLVDLSAREVAGEYLRDTGDEKRVRQLARSQDLWERRIAIIASWAWIKAGDLALTFELAEFLAGDHEDLIHKATGWMLRECGKADEQALEAFLASEAPRLPRTTLRYAIEKLPEPRRRHWLATA